MNPLDLLPVRRLCVDSRLGHPAGSDEEWSSHFLFPLKEALSFPRDTTCVLESVSIPTDAVRNISSRNNRLHVQERRAYVERADAATDGQTVFAVTQRPLVLPSAHYDNSALRTALGSALNTGTSFAQVQTGYDLASTVWTPLLSGALVPAYDLTVTLCTDANWTVNGMRWHVAFHDGAAGYMRVTNSSTNGDKITLDLGDTGHTGTITQGYGSVASTIIWDTPPPTIGGEWHYSPGALPLFSGSFGSRSYVVGGTGDALEVGLSGTSGGSHRFRVYYHSELKALGLDDSRTCLAELGRWRGESTLQANAYSSDPPLETALRLTIEDEAFYLHSTRLTGHGGVDPSGRRSCIARIPLDSSLCVHWRNLSSDIDKIWLGNTQINTLDFSLRDSFGNVVSLDKAMSLQLLFTIAP